MKIGCACVTEDRAPIFGISLASYLTQLTPSGMQKMLFIGVRGDPDPYQSVVNRLTNVYGMDTSGILLTSMRGGLSVPAMQHLVCETLFSFDCDVVGLWDDDDWYPPERLRRAAVLTNKYEEFVCGLDGGYFVNLRTLRGTTVTLGRPWGSSLAFTRGAFKLVGGFERGPWPGQDKAFIKAAWNAELPVVTNRASIFAFSHGKNVATWLLDGGVADLSNHIEDKVGPLAWAEIKAAQQLMVDTRTFPPGSEVT